MSPLVGTVENSASLHTAPTHSPEPTDSLLALKKEPPQKEKSDEQSQEPTIPWLYFHLSFFYPSKYKINSPPKPEPKRVQKPTIPWLYFHLSFFYPFHIFHYTTRKRFRQCFFFFCFYLDTIETTMYFLSKRK